ncbi:hypothetical protein COCSADRAFT_303886 [Bipolaris sorokiniana ND90Pr]|uniref:Uncharacterized protein n=1 Tax=Cochliobolus sativus (strain ND90Pr / ATCC 201652) TaxID=665912 RepID=M2T7T0_COCSN|nr:uncharacterized protein COCSADRAFT_303886 [Bipolaris sorokiniana ND90Pr]EMD65291.1 hypothetical protein COCSADRAFT_303886 [Bipolaris sorokiniana ND90Pr]
MHAPLDIIVPPSQARLVHPRHCHYHCHYHCHASSTAMVHPVRKQIRRTSLSVFVCRPLSVSLSNKNKNITNPNPGENQSQTSHPLLIGRILSWFPHLFIFFLSSPCSRLFSVSPLSVFPLRTERRRPPLVRTCLVHILLKYLSHFTSWPLHLHSQTTLAKGIRILHFETTSLHPHPQKVAGSTRQTKKKRTRKEKMTDIIPSKKASDLPKGQSSPHESTNASIA